MSSWVDVPLIKGAIYAEIKDPQATAYSEISIQRSSADTQDAQITRRQTGRFRIQFAKPVRDNQTVRYQIRNPAGQA